MDGGGGQNAASDGPQTSAVGAAAEGAFVQVPSCGTFLYVPSCYAMKTAMFVQRAFLQYKPKDYELFGRAHTYIYICMYMRM